jgi:hypothetical protein
MARGGPKTPAPRSAQGARSQAEEDRLAKALRENLQRRKQQAQARRPGAAPVAATGPDPED